jgi:hypothetical protein
MVHLNLPGHGSASVPVDHCAPRRLTLMVGEIQRLSGLMTRLEQSSGQENEDIAALQLQARELDRVKQQNAALVEEIAGRLATAVQVFRV